MKKILLLILALILTLCSFFLMSSCSYDNEIVDPNLTFYDLGDGTLGVAGHELIGNEDTSLSISPYPINNTVKEISIPEKVSDKTITKIMPWGFSNYLSLEKIELPETITEFADYSFQNCHKLAEINLPDNLHTLGKDCFLNCNNLNLSTIDNSCEYLGSSNNPYKFLVKTIYDTNNTVYTVHEGCEVMLSKCIDDNTITTLILPESLKKIHKQAFYTYGGLTSIYYNCNLSKWGDSYIEAIINISKQLDKDMFSSNETNIRAVYYLNEYNQYVGSNAYQIYQTLESIGFFN